MKLQMMRDAERHSREQETRAQDRRDMMDAITAIAQGVAVAFGASKPKKKRKTSKNGNWTDDSDASERSY